MSNILQQIIVAVKDSIAQLPQFRKEILQNGGNPEEYLPMLPLEELSELLGVPVMVPLDVIVLVDSEGNHLLGANVVDSRTNTLQIHLAPLVFLYGERMLNRVLADEFTHVLSGEDHDHPNYLSILGELLGEPIENPIPIPTDEEDERAHQEFDRLVPQTV